MAESVSCAICRDCRYEAASVLGPICKDCAPDPTHFNFKPKISHICATCRHEGKTLMEEPCVSCSIYKRTDRWEAKDEAD